MMAHTGLTAFESWPAFGDMLGATYGHIHQTVTAGNYAPYNFLMIFADGFKASDLQVIGITGSYGKTSTKFIIAEILRQGSLVEPQKGILLAALSLTGGKANCTAVRVSVPMIGPGSTYIPDAARINPPIEFRGTSPAASWKFPPGCWTTIRASGPTNTSSWNCCPPGTRSTTTCPDTPCVS